MWMSFITVDVEMAEARVQLPDVWEVSQVQERARNQMVGMLIQRGQEGDKDASRASGELAVRW